MSDEKTPYELAVERATEDVGILGGIALLSDPESFLAIREAEAKRRGISLSQLDEQMRQQVLDALEKAARDRGLTHAELLQALDKELEFDMRIIEHMRMCGVEVRGRWQATLAARDGLSVKSGRSNGGAATARERRIDRGDNATEAASIWDSLTMPERNRAAVIAQRMGVTAATVRTWLAESGRKAKRR